MRRFYSGKMLLVVATLSLFHLGCGMGLMVAGTAARDTNSEDATGLAAQVAGKALIVGERIGGEDGFGGDAVDGYLSHMDDHMGFHAATDLADPEGLMTVVLHNESDEDSTFDVVYVASHMGLDDQLMEVDVAAAQEVTLELPCSEIIGLGSLTRVGETAVYLNGGIEFDNTMSVPAFLGSDFLCEDTYHCFLAADVDDLDGDGDREELIVTTEALTTHAATVGIDGFGHMMMGTR